MQLFAFAIPLIAGQSKFGAACLDGSVPYIYLDKGSGDDINKWLFWFGGGGWCVGFEQQLVSGVLDSCLHRADTHKGSSKYFPNVEQRSCKLCDEVPLWNRVLVRYCDGGSLSANLEKPVPVFDASTNETTLLYFRGKRTLIAIVDELRANYSLANATEVLITGNSAGGLGAYLHGDFLLDEIEAIAPNLSLSGIVPSAGFFMEYESETKQFVTAMRWIFEAQNASSSLPQACVAHYAATDDAWKCFFAANAAPFIRHRVFAQQSRFDSWQLEHILGIDKGSDKLLVNEFGTNLTELLRSAVVNNRPENGAFLESCSYHSINYGTEMVEINGTVIGDAVMDWFYSTNDNTFYFQNITYQCKKCCGKKPIIQSTVAMSTTTATPTRIPTTTPTTTPTKTPTTTGIFTTTEDVILNSGAVIRDGYNSVSVILVLLISANAYISLM